MHKLASSFVLGYHGCDRNVAEKLLAGGDFKPSNNDYDWLGPGVYFWEANPLRGLEFARELKKLKRGPSIETPAVVGAVIELGLCLDCAVIEMFHNARRDNGLAPVDSVRAVFTEGAPIYEESDFLSQTHIQICVCNPDCIKGVFRVPNRQLT